MQQENPTDNRRLILYNPETGKTRKLRLGFSWPFFLFGAFGFFFYRHIKEGLIWILGLFIAYCLFDSEGGYYHLFDFKYVLLLS